MTPIVNSSPLERAMGNRTRMTSLDCRAGSLSTAFNLVIVTGRIPSGRTNRVLLAWRYLPLTAHLSVLSQELRPFSSPEGISRIRSYGLAALRRVWERVILTAGERSGARQGAWGFGLSAIGEGS
jgi:hypothetical protein